MHLDASFCRARSHLLRTTALAAGPSSANHAQLTFTTADPPAFLSCWLRLGHAMLHSGAVPAPLTYLPAAALAAVFAAIAAVGQHLRRRQQRMQRVVCNRQPCSAPLVHARGWEGLLQQGAG